MAHQLLLANSSFVNRGLKPYIAFAPNPFSWGRGQWPTDQYLLNPATRIH